MDTFKKSNLEKPDDCPVLNTYIIFKRIDINWGAYLIITLLLHFFNLTSFGQSQHFYGHIPDHHYSAKDILQLENGNIIVLGVAQHVGYTDVFWSYDEYIVEINKQGDTIRTSNLPHGTWPCYNAIERADNDGIFVWGNTANYALCGGVFITLGFRDYYIRTYDSNGLHINTSIMKDEACNTDIVNTFKNDQSIGGITRISVLGNKSLYSIKHINREGILSNFDININGYFTKIIKPDFGFLIYNAEKKTIHRLFENGNPMWAKDSPSASLVDIFLVEDDNMLFQATDNHIIKTDNMGNELWNNTYQMSIKNIMKHSSGNYLMTGVRDGQLAVQAISPDGDSIALHHYMVANNAYSIFKTIELDDGSIAILTGDLTRIPFVDTTLNKYVVTFDTLDLPVINSNKSLGTTTDLMLFPNPTQDFFTIQTSDKYTNLQLMCYNSIGHLIATHQLLDSPAIISTAGWQNGQYFLNVIDNKGNIIQTGKLMVDH